MQMYHLLISSIYYYSHYSNSNVRIIQYDWLIALYIFISLVGIAIFLIVKNSGVREELSYVNKSLCNNVSSRLCASPLVRAPPQLTLFTSPNTPSTPRNIRGRKFPTL